MNRLRVGLLLLGLGWAGPGVSAQGTSNIQAERDRIALERASVEARFSEQKAACQVRFAVTDCVDDARRERREALAPLQRQAIALDEAQRKERAARRLEVLRKRAADSPERAVSEIVVRDEPASSPATPAASPDGPVPAAASAAQSPRPARAAVSRRAKEVESLASRQQRESAYRARLESRKRAVQAHRKDVERRNADRASRGRSAAPLPVPASGASR